jgi:AcrR family transcriptional regulator
MVRPATPLLSRDGIVDAAFAVVDSDGPGGLTLRRLASELGVSAPSLYNHINGVDELVELMRERISQRVLPPRRTRTGDDAAAVAEVAVAYFDALCAHPGVLPVLLAHPVRSAVAVATYEAMASTMVERGFEPRVALDLVLSIDALVVGMALVATGPGLRAGGLPDAPTIKAGLGRRRGVDYRHLCRDAAYAMALPFASGDSPPKRAGDDRKG